jgi:iron uptake system component EfeO
MRPLASRPRSAVAVVAVAGAIGLLSTACSSTSTHASNPSRTTGDVADHTTRTVDVTLTSTGCAAPLATYPAGPLTFHITNKDATAVSELELLSGDRILGEKENLPPGFSGTFALQLAAGEYSLYCPGATTDKTPLKVTGASSGSVVTGTQALLAQGTKEYAAYITAQTSLLVTAVKPLVAALHGTDLTAAQTAYMKSRSYYEHVEPVAESFTDGKQNLDAEIDARAGDVPASQWQGFHYIERGLFESKSLTGLASYGDGLLTHVERLHQLVTGLTYQPAELANGAVSLLDEVAKSKITGEEERYSHIDLLDFQANVEGSQQAFACVQAGLARIDPALAQTISAAFGQMQSLLSTYRTTSNASGFVFYGTLTDTDKTHLSQALQAVAEPLSRVASKIVNG